MFFREYFGVFPNLTCEKLAFRKKPILNTAEMHSKFFYLVVAKCGTIINKIFIFYFYFIFGCIGHMVKDHTAREEAHCCHMGCSFQQGAVEAGLV